MSLKRWAARRDGTEPAIVQALARVGAETVKLDKFDLLVLFRGQLFMLDPKRRGGEATPSQQQLIQRGFPLRLVETPEDALRAIGAV